MLLERILLLMLEEEEKKNCIRCKIPLTLRVTLVFILQRKKIWHFYKM